MTSSLLVAGPRVQTIFVLRVRGSFLVGIKLSTLEDYKKGQE